MILVPDGFDPAAVLPADLARYADGAAWLVNLIIRGAKRADRRGYVPLKVPYLRQVIPDRAERRVRQALVRAGVIECDGTYVIGRKSMGYRLAPRWQRTRPVRTACRSVRAERKVQRAVARAAGKRLTDPVHLHLQHWYERLTIDTAAADEEIAGTPALLKNAVVHGATVDELSSPDRAISVGASGRVQSAFTRLPRKLRGFVTLGGEPLVGVDVSCCQPLLLAVVASQYTTRGGYPTGYRALSRRALGTGTYLPRHQPSLSLILKQTTHTTRTPNTMSNLPGEIPEDPCYSRLALFPTERNSNIGKFLNLCERGSLYERLAKLLSGHGFKVKRQGVKKLLAVYLFGKDAAAEKCGAAGAALARVLEEEFPAIAATIAGLKRGPEGHAYLARLLHRYESSVMIDRVCRRIMNERPDVPVITLHDGIYTTAPYVALVEHAIMIEFRRIGLGVRVKAA